MHTHQTIFRSRNLDRSDVRYAAVIEHASDVAFRCRINDVAFIWWVIFFPCSTQVSIINSFHACVVFRTVVHWACVARTMNIMKIKLSVNSRKWKQPGKFMSWVELINWFAPVLGIFNLPVARFILANNFPKVYRLSSAVVIHRWRQTYPTYSKR